jgi:hypothetical protein
VSLAYIRKTYGVPAYRGAEFLFMGRIIFRVTSSKGHCIRAVSRDGSRGVFHPTWEIEYLPQSLKKSK